MKILQLMLAKTGFTRTNKTSFVPKTVVQTFKNTQKTDYTKVETGNTCAAKIVDMKEKFAQVDAEKYLAEAKQNGTQTLQVSDADFETYGMKWDKYLAS